MTVTFKPHHRLQTDRPARAERRQHAGSWTACSTHNRGDAHRDGPANRAHVGTSRPCLGAKWLVAGAWALWLGGCVVGVGDFDPRGNEVSLSGTWSINGTPATAESCAQAQVATVQVRIFENRDDAFTEDPNFLRFPCETGSFDTRPEAVLENGRYFIAWSALSESGEVLGESEQRTIDVTFEDHAALGNSDFTLGNRAFTVNLSWDSDPGPGEVLGGCGALQDRLRNDLNQPELVLNMAYTLEKLSPTGGEPEVVETQNNALCKDTSSEPPFRFEKLVAGNYQLTVEGVDGSGGKLPAGFPYVTLCGPYTLSEAEQSVACNVVVNNN